MGGNPQNRKWSDYLLGSCTSEPLFWQPRPLIDVHFSFQFWARRKLGGWKQRTRSPDPENMGVNPFRFEAFLESQTAAFAVGPQPQEEAWGVGLIPHLQPSLFSKAGCVVSSSKLCWGATTRIRDVCLFRHMMLGGFANSTCAKYPLTHALIGRVESSL